MWFVNNRVRLDETDIFKGFTDWHSHILPDVDDGIATIQESLQVLKEYEKMGVRKVWLTPHIMEDIPNSTERLRTRFEILKESWTGEVEIALSSENMLDNIFEQRLKDKDLLPIGENRNHILIETSYFSPPFGMMQRIESIKETGLIPILAHPERYVYMNSDNYNKLRDKGIKFQINLFSFTGHYGEQAKKKSEWLAEQGMIDYVGSDIHRFSTLQSELRVKVSRKSLKLLEKVISDL